ncbi:hydrolase [Pyrus ussuriensis x Pyrus communis]|uniref:Hydrolase n=1 Tax=Pyrus ussuriensis x Pyrus communis TaxID=2448454 RepID=A0A5N5HFL3_9ROSA|nr:hydrolase [Pyrus ussuriensis x Pyrus communis]KAB2626799.1 hydrolase [Pyrus ussuriensis x Pyrus communis]
MRGHPKLRIRGTQSAFDKNMVMKWCLNFYNSATTGAGSPCEQSEIIFIGTSEGIPRVSCLTNPLKICAVCLQGVEPGNRNKRLNTSILIRYPRPSGNYNIHKDAGKFFYSIIVLSNGLLPTGNFKIKLSDVDIEA